MTANPTFLRIKNLALNQRGWTELKENDLKVELNREDYHPETGCFYNYEALRLKCHGSKITMEIHDDIHHLATILWDTDKLERTWTNQITTQQFKGKFVSLVELEANISDRIKNNPK